MNALTPFDMTGYANDPAKLDACNKWVAACKPIIKAFLVLDDEAVSGLTLAASAERTGLKWSDPRTPMEREYREAQAEIEGAAKTIRAQLEGIREAFINDEQCGLQDCDIAQEAADEFNDWLSEKTTSVDDAIKAVSDEVYAEWLASFRRKVA